MRLIARPIGPKSFKTALLKGKFDFWVNFMIDKYKGILDITVRKMLRSYSASPNLRNYKIKRQTVSSPLHIARSQ